MKIDNLSENISVARVAPEESKPGKSLYHHQILRALPVAAYTCDSKGRIDFYNHPAVKLWGHAPELNHAMWCGSVKLFYPNGNPMPLNECPLAKMLREGKNTRGEEMVIERPNGSRVRVQAFPAPIVNSLGFVEGAVNTLVDVANLRVSAE